jgi:hypothetical protein
MEPAIMHSPVMNVNEMIEQLNQLQLPTSLMESFDAFREEAVRAASQGFNDAQLAWFLDLLNRFRGPNDHKGSLVDVFDPGMFTCDHPGWEAAPGTRIELAALTSEVAEFAGPDSEFMGIARQEIERFREYASGYSDVEILGLANVARSALVDRGKLIACWEDAIRYVAMNASARLEDLWAYDDTLWRLAPPRIIDFDDMVERRKQALLRFRSASQFQERDFACYSEDEVRTFAFDARNLFLADRAKHLAICAKCQSRLEYWTGLVQQFDRATTSPAGRTDA